MSIRLRPGTSEDADVCGQICYDAFKAISDQHNFPADFPSPEVGIGVVSMLLAHPGFYAVVAERDGQIVGSNFLDERCPIAGVGPITVDPAAQNRGVGRLLMQNVLDRATERGFPGVRLLQDTYHNRSFALYTKLGFQVRETVAVMQGAQVHTEIPGCSVRPTSESDLDACNRLCTRVHGHDRGGELADAIKQGTALVVEGGGRITGYATIVGFFGHSVGETNEDLKALIASTSEFAGSGFHVPTRNSDLLNWCLENDLRMVKAMTVMSLGLYNEPKGVFMPSVLY